MSNFTSAGAFAAAASFHAASAACHVFTVSSPCAALIGCDWLQEIEHQFAEFAGQTFAISGIVTDQRVIPAKAAAVRRASPRAAPRSR